MLHAAKFRSLLHPSNGLPHFPSHRYFTSVSTDLVHLCNHPSRWQKSPSLFSKLAPQREGPFGFRELTTPDGFHILFDRVKQNTTSLLEEAFDHNRSRTRNIVNIFDDLSDGICQVADMSECMRLLHPQSAYRSAAQTVCLQIQEIVENLNTHVSLYQVIAHICSQQTDLQPMDSVDLRVLEAFLADFHISGIHLAENQRQQFVTETQRAFELGAEFMEGTNQPSFVPRGMLPSALESHLESHNEQIVVSHPYADHADAQLRKAAYILYHIHQPSQESLLVHLLTCRFHIAQSSDFACFADRATKHTLGESSDNVKSFLNQVASQLQPIAQKELHLLKEHFQLGELGVWDLHYYKSLVRNTSLQSEDVLGMYFSLGACMHGVQLLCEALFGIQLAVQIDVDPGELWHPSVMKLNVSHSTEGYLGAIYCDFFQRPGRSAQDCHFTVRGGRQLANGTYQTPIVVLQLNMGVYPQSTGRPPLLTLSMVENLFHEFGHALHSMMGRTRYQHVTGTRCSTDFAEVPSTLLEKFAFHPTLMVEYARHWQTNAPLPPDWVANIELSRNFLPALNLQHHAILALMDQHYHDANIVTNLQHRSSSDLFLEMHNAYYPIPMGPPIAYQHRLNHLVNYGGRYYSYLMANAVANLLWKQCFEANPLSRSAGESYRRNLLAYGGEKPAKELIESVIGESLTLTGMVNAMVDEVNFNKDQSVAILSKI